MADEDDPVVLEVNLDVNDAQARQEFDRAGDRAGAAFAASMATAAGKAGGKIAGTIDKSLRGANIGKIFDPFNIGAKQAQVSARLAGASFQDLVGDLAALQKRSEATKRTLSQIGADPDLFANVDRIFERITNNIRKFESSLATGNKDPAVLRGLIESLQNDRVLIGRETQAVQQELRNLKVIQQREGNAINRAADRVAQERLVAQRGAAGLRVAETQREAALTLAETKIAGQRQLQDERQRSRARIELVRFTYNQIRVLERGIAGVFRATGTIANSAYRTLAGAAARIGGLFTRSNRDLNEGLNGALLRRETSIDRSFRRQTSDIRRSVTEQSTIIRRFESQASTGIAGALTGRSTLGALFGGGLAFGGGFAAFQGLRNGVQVGGDFVQGLAVLGAQLELTDAQMAAVRQQSIDLGNDITLPGVSALDAAQAIQLLAKQFANLGATALPSAQAAAKGVLQLSRAVGVQADEAARVVGAAVNVFGIDAARAVEVADQITNAMTKSAGVAFNDFADAFTQSAGVVRLFTGPAAEATTTLAEFNAAIAVLAKNGLIGSDAGTSLKQFFLQANRGTEDSKKILNEIVDRAGVAGSVFFDAAGGARTLGESLDILRRGTEGLSNQQLTQTLGKLFGSDAARAASFLIGETSANFARLTQDMLKQGSAAAIAEAQNTGLRGALDALGSVIETQQIKTYERFQGVLGRVVLRFADLLNAFFEGKGALGLVRTGLTGVAIALGGLLAVKVVAEGFQFLALSLRAVVTPLGLIVTGLAAVGAAVALLSRVSPEFRTELGRIGETLQGATGQGLSIVGDGLARVAGFVRTTVLPVLVDLGVGLARIVAPAIEAVIAKATQLGTAFRAGFSGEGVSSNGLVGFFERLGVGLRQVGVAAEAFRAALSGEAFTSVLTDSGLLNEERQTTFVRFAERLGQAVAGLRSALSGEGVTSTGLVGFGERVGVALRQAALGVQAFRAALSGREFTDVLTTSGVLNEERQTAFVRFLESAGAAVRGVFDRVVEVRNAISDAFSGVAAGEALAALGGTADAIERLTASGRNNFSGLEDLARRAAIAVANVFVNVGSAAVAVIRPQLERVLNFVGDFLSGTGGGVAAKAAGGLTRFLTGPLQQGVEEVGFIIANIATDPRVVATAEKLVALAVLTGVNFVKGLGRGIGDNIGALGVEFGKQLLTGLRVGLTAALSSPGGFLKLIAAGLLASRALRIWQQAGEAGAKGVASGFAAGAKRAVVSPAQFISGLFGGPQALNNAAAKAAFSAADKMRTEFDRINRDRGRLGLTAIELPATGLNDFNLKKFRSELDLAKANMGSTRAEAVLLRTRVAEAFTGLSGASTAIKDSFADLSRSVGGAGKAVGQILGTGIMSGVAAALAGQQLGTASSATGKGIGLAGIIGSALFAGIAVGGGPIGLAVGGLVASVGVASAVIANSGRKAEEAAARVDTYAAALRNADSAAAQIGNIGDVVVDLIGKQEGPLDEFGRRMLRFAKFDANAFTAAVLDGASAMDAFDAAIAGTPTDFANVNKGLSGYQDVLDFINTAAADILAAQRIADDVAFFDRTPPGLEPTARGIGSIATELERTNALARNTDAAIASFGARAELQAQRAATQIGNVGLALDRLNENRTGAINLQIGDLTTRLDGAKTAADQALQAVLALLSPDEAGSFERLFDAALQAIPGVADQISELLGKGVKIFDVTAAGADLRALANQFEDRAKEAIAKALTDNPALGVAGLRDVLKPLSAEISLIPDAATRGLLQGILDNFINNPALEGALGNVQITDAAVEDLNNRLAGLNAQLLVDIQFSPAQVQAALKALGLPSLSTGDIVNSLGLTDALPGISRSEQVQAQRDALVVGQQSARDLAGSSTTLDDAAARLERSADALERAASGPPPQVIIQQTITGSTNPTVTAIEQQKALAGIAAGGGGTGGVFAAIIAGARQ